MKVELKKALKSREFKSRKTETLIPIGVGFNFEYVFENLKDLKSIRMAGTTGSGKSTFGHSVIISLLKQKNYCSLFLCDCKRVEFSPYNDIKKIAGNVATRVNEIKEQFQYLEKEFFIRSVRKKEGVDIYERYFPLVIIVDECSDIMVNEPDYFNGIIPKIAKEGPDLNIFIIIYTSRPASNVFTREILESFHTKIAFNVPTAEQSKNLIEQTGAEKLLGRGDMLYKKGDQPPKRLQGFYVSDEDIKNVIRQTNGFLTFNETGHLLAENINKNVEREEIEDKFSPIIEKTLIQFGIKSEIEKVNIGPRITQFILKFNKKTKLSKIMDLQNVLAMNLKVRSLRIDSSYFKNGFVGIEISNYDLTE